MKKTFLFFFSIFLSGYFLFFPLQTFAHFPATDKNIIVVLHADPDDAPIPEQPATLYFLINDTTGKFKLAQCDCTVRIFEQGKQIFSQKLTEQKTSKPSIWGASLPYSFPKRDVYKISMTGNPTIPNAFQPFNVSWNFRVDQYPEDSSFSFYQILPYVGVGLGISSVLLVILFFGARLVHNKKRK